MYCALLFPSISSLVLLILKPPRWSHQRLRRRYPTRRLLPRLGSIPAFGWWWLPSNRNRHTPYSLPTLYLAGPPYGLFPVRASQQSCRAGDV